MPSNYILGMQKATKKVCSIVYQFNLLNSKYQNTFFYFVEGEDFDYYNFRIKKMFPGKKTKNLICDGKKNVIDVCRNIVGKYNCKNNNCYGFFVDRDYGFENVPDDIYKTELYSIENFYATEEAIFSVIENVLKVDSQSDNYLKCKEYFASTYWKYSLFAKHMNSFFYTIRKKEKTENCGHVNFDIFSLGNFIECCSLTDFTLRELTYKELLDMYQVSYDVDDTEFASSEIFFDENNHFNFRGKFELDYVKWFLKSLKNAISNGSFGFDKERTCKIDFYVDTMLSLCSYATTSESLNNYILLQESKQKSSDCNVIMV